MYPGRFTTLDENEPSESGTGFPSCVLFSQVRGKSDKQRWL